MANIAPPKSRTTKGAPPASGDSAGALAKPTERAGSADLVPLNFKVAEAVRTDMKISAAMCNVTMAAMIQEAFALWKKEKGL